MLVRLLPIFTTLDFTFSGMTAAAGRVAVGCATCVCPACLRDPSGLSTTSCTAPLPLNHHQPQEVVINHSTLLLRFHSTPFLHLLSTFSTNFVFSTFPPLHHLYCPTQLVGLVATPPPPSQQPFCILQWGQASYLHSTPTKDDCDNLFYKKEKECSIVASLPFDWQ